VARQKQVREGTETCRAVARFLDIYIAERLNKILKREELISMSNAEYKFTNENADVRGRVAEVVEFAKSRGIFVKQVQVFKDPDALKDADTTHVVSDTPFAEDEGDCDGKCEGCGDPCCYNHPEYAPEDMPLSDEDKEEMAMSLAEFFADLFGLNS
jgi:hypothetical protein